MSTSPDKQDRRAHPRLSGFTATYLRGFRLPEYRVEAALENDRGRNISGTEEFFVDFLEGVLSKTPRDLELLRMLSELYERCGRSEEAKRARKNLREAGDPAAEEPYNVALTILCDNNTNASLETAGLAADSQFNETGDLPGSQPKGASFEQNGFRKTTEDAGEKKPRKPKKK